MPFDHSELAAGMANLAVRALHQQVRQATTDSATATATSSSVSLPSSTVPSTSAATATPTDTGSGTGSGNTNSGNSGSSPLLFFVALGFGVVFTNLWIIVGVKYCFRYNARNRNMRMTGEDGEPINLENIPAHPRRRRREKKLMTIDEVNEKFPMMKYKSWVASRAQEGLPTQGGISQPPSRAGSIQDADGIIPLNKERDSIDDTRTTGGASLTRSATHNTHDDPVTVEHAEKADGHATDASQRRSIEGAAGATTAAAPEPARTTSPASDSDHDEEDDQIHDALPPEALESSGDTCAICIDTLEDDDDVRGLTCGHAFHAVCLDPWLTSRRACCPLCKADYYIPKARPPAPEGAQNTEMGPTVSINQDPRTRMNMPSRPGVAWVFGRGRRVGLPLFNRNRNSQTPVSPRTPNSPRRSQHNGLISRAATAARADRSRTANNAPATTENQTGGGFFSNLRMPRLQLPGRSATAGNTAEVTPSNLEAGNRVEAAR